MQYSCLVPYGVGVIVQHYTEFYCLVSCYVVQNCVVSCFSCCTIFCVSVNIDIDTC